LTDNTITSTATSNGTLLVHRGSGVRLRGGNALNASGANWSVVVSNGSNLIQDTAVDTVSGKVEVHSVSIAQFDNAEITGNIDVHQHAGVRIRNRSGVSGKTVLTGDTTVFEDGYIKFVKFSLLDLTFDVAGAVTCNDDESSARAHGGVSFTGAGAGITTPVACDF